MNAPVLQTDWFRADNARKLAQRIETYWAVRGQTVHCTVQHMTGVASQPGGYVIRSDMLNGFPRSA